MSVCPDALTTCGWNNWKWLVARIRCSPAKSGKVGNGVEPCIYKFRCFSTIEVESIRLLR